MINKLAKSISAATVLAMAVSLAPQSAFAEEEVGIGEYSGGATNQSSFRFDLNFSVADVNPDNSVGYFPGAIQNLNFFNNGNLVNDSPIFCGTPVCPAGNVKVTKLSTDPTSANVLDLYIGSDRKQVKLAGLQDLLSKTDQLPPGFDFRTNDIVRYDVTLGNNSEPDLIFFLQSKDSNLINNLSGLSGFTDKIPGLLPRDAGVSDDGNTGVNTGGTFSFNLRATSQRIPEPTAIVGLLGVGFLGTLSLLKRSDVRSFVKNQTRAS